MTKPKQGGARPGAGRKRLPDAERRRRPVLMKLTDPEFAGLKRAAGREPLATFARRAVLAAAKRVKS